MLLPGCNILVSGPCLRIQVASDFESLMMPSTTVVFGCEDRNGSRLRSRFFDRTKTRSVKSFAGLLAKDLMTALPAEPVPPSMAYVSVLREKSRLTDL